MRDRLDHHGMNDDAGLAAALRALPDATPPSDAWTLLAARTQRRRTTRRILWTGLPAALAAGIALFVAWPQLTLHHATPAPVPARIVQSSGHAPTARTAPATDLAALQASSQQWQAWVATLDRDGAPLGAPALAQAVNLQDRIGLVDLQLSAARDPVAVAALWQQRITLLQRLGLLHLQPYTVAQHTQVTRDTTFM